MERNKALFFAIQGSRIDQRERIKDIGSGFQCWNLKLFARDEFFNALKQAIPPITDNVLQNYASEHSGDDRFGTSDARYDDCAWGLLIPVAPGGGGMFGIAEALFLLELYAPTFPTPLFYGSDFGIICERSLKPALSDRFVDLSKIFTRPEFVSFFQMLFPQAQYGTWFADRVKLWTQEDWRLFAATLIYRGLREYGDGKDSFGWQRESADMSCVLEALFTAEDRTRKDIGKRLRRRLGVLLSGAFPTVESDVKKLYDQRSAFVHGSFFAQMAQASKERDHGLPTPDFFFLEGQRERVRWALIAYLHLAQLSGDPRRYNGKTRVIDILEEAITNADLCKKIRGDLEPIFSLLS